MRLRACRNVLALFAERVGQVHHLVKRRHVRAYNLRIKPIPSRLALADSAPFHVRRAKGSDRNLFADFNKILNRAIDEAGLVGILQHDVFAAASSAATRARASSAFRSRSSASPRTNCSGAMSSRRRRAKIIQIRPAAPAAWSDIARGHYELLRIGNHGLNALLGASTEIGLRR